MFKKQTHTKIVLEKPVRQEERLEEILKSIEGLIFAIKMQTYQYTSTSSYDNGNKTVDYSYQEMIAKKDMLFNLMPKDELYALTKRKSTNPNDLIAPRN